MGVVEVLKSTADTYQPSTSYLGHVTEIFSLALITRIFKSRYRTKYSPTQEVIFARAFEALRPSLSELHGSIARYSITGVKKRHIFLANLTKILKHSLSVQEIFFGQKFHGKMLKIMIKASFCTKSPKMVSMFAIRLPRRKQIALRIVR